MRVQNLMALSVAAALVAGCAAPVPVAQNFPRTYQKVARTAQHWDVVAKDVVAHTGKMVAASSQLKDREFYVPVGQRHSFFDSTFREFLIDHMVNSGMPVLACPTGDIAPGFQQAPEVTISYDTRVVRHAEMPAYQPGLMTVLATGIFALHGAAQLDHVDKRVAGAIAGIAGVDTWIAQMPDETKTELIITVTIQERNRFIMRRSLIYYVPDGDIELFSTRAAGKSQCGRRNDTVTSAPAQQQAALDRDAEMDRLRSEKVERDMVRFNDKYRAKSGARFFY